MNRTVVVLLICLAVLPILAGESFSMIRTLPVPELVRDADYIVIGEVRRIEVDDTHPPESGRKGYRHLTNEIRIEESLKGDWPRHKPMMIGTVGTDYWLEDNVEFPLPGTRVVLFVKKERHGKVSLVNGIQGLWPMQNGKLSRMGTGKTIDDIRTIIEQQVR